MSQLSSRTSTRRHKRYTHALARLETLEPRTLLSASISTYALPAGVQAVGGTYDDNNTLWLVDQTSLLRVNSDHSVTPFAIPGAIANTDGAPVNILAGHNGILYITDFFGAIDEFTISSQTFTHQTTWDIGANFEFIPRAATLSGNGSLWFVTTGLDNASATDDVRTSYVARYDINTHALTIPGPDLSPFAAISTDSINPTDSEALFISAHGQDGAYVGMKGVEFQPEVGPTRFGANRIADVSFSTSVSVDHIWSVDTGDANADTFGYLNGIATDANGSVWFAMANVDDPSSARTVHPADRLVNGVYNTVTDHLDQTPYTVTGATDGTPLAIGNLAMDDAGRLWFNEFQGTQMGYFDTTALQYAPTPFLSYPSSLQLELGGAVSSIFTGQGNNQVSMIVFDGTPDDGSPLVQATVDDVNPPTFSNFNATLAGTHVEDVSQTLNVSFTASAPVNAAQYEVTINWGDGSLAQSVDAGLVSGQYTASQAHTYVNEGTFTITITVTDGDTQVAPPLTINPVISDTPLAITSFSATNLVGRLYVATLTFTDDIDAQASQFTVTINWGDSITTRGHVIADPFHPGTFLLVAMHPFRRPGTYQVTATITTTENNIVTTSNPLTIVA